MVVVVVVGDALAQSWLGDQKNMPITLRGFIPQLELVEKDNQKMCANQNSCTNGIYNKDGDVFTWRNPDARKCAQMSRTACQ